MSVSHKLSHQDKKMCTWEDVVKGHRFPSLAFCSYESEKVRVEVRKWERQLRTVHLVFTLQSAARMQVERRRRRRRSWTSQKCISHLILLKIAPGCVKVSCLTRQLKLLTSLLAGNIWTISCQLTSAHQRRSWISQRCISDLRCHWPRILLDDKQRSKEQLKPRERESSQLTLSDHLHSWPQVAAWSSADFGFKFKMHAILDP